MTDGQIIGNQTSSTQNSNVNTDGAAFVGSANFTGGGHTFGNNSTVNNNSSNKGIIGDGSNNTVISGDNSGNQTHHNYGGNKQYNQTIKGNVNIYGGTHGLENLKEFVSFAALHDSAEQDPDRCCHPGTRKSVLSQLRHWIDNPNPTDRIFWLHGPAGAGKSAIAQTIARGYNKGEVAATFFFYRSDSARNDGNRLFTTIAWQLAFSIPAVKDVIVNALDKAPHLPRKDVETQFKQLVAQPMNSITSRIPQLAPIIIIDGVDECSDEQLQRRCLAAIGNAVKDSDVPLRFLICSRPEALIEETLDQFKDFTLRVDLATLDDANRDIDKYLMNKFSEIASKQHLDPLWPGQEIVEDIVFKSSGNFILASTLIRFIGDKDHSAVTQLDIFRKLKPQGTMSPFALLDELYLEILKRQPDQEFLKTFLALIIGRSSIKQDVFYNGVFHNSVFHIETFNHCTFYNSTFHNSVFSDDSFNHNVFHNSVINNTSFNNDAFNHSVFHNSAINNNTFNNDAFNHNVFHNSAVNNNAFNNDAFNHNVFHSTDVNTNAFNNSSFNNRPFNNSVVRNGELHNGDNHDGELHNGDIGKLHKDDAKLMNVSEEELHIKLRKMRSLLKFEPFIDVYHKSFLDFLQDSSRSGRYHISKQSGQKRYLELVVDAVVRHVSMVIEQPNYHETCRSSPKFKYIISKYPPAVDLSVEEWEETLKPLLDLQDKLLNTSKLLPCRVTQTMRDLLLTLKILQSKAHPIVPAPAQAQKSNMTEIFTKWSRALVTKARTIQAEQNDLNSCLSLLLSRLQKTYPVMVVDMAIIDCMSSLFTFDCSETARGVHSVSAAQRLIDLVELLINDQSILNQCGPDAARKAARLASEIFARVPLLPRSFLNGPLRLYISNVELLCQTAFISRILNHNYMVSSFEIRDESDVKEYFDKWLQRSNPSFVIRILVMLEIARIIRYIHSMDIALLAIEPGVFVLDSNLRTKILFGGLFTWWGSEARIYGHEDTSLHTYESNISDFADLFHSACFDDGIPPNNVNGPVEDARKLIERCRAEDTKSRPTMEDVVEEMETWDLM